MEWLLPYYWAAACGSSVGPEEHDDVDLAVVAILYCVLAEQVVCGTCAAPLEPVPDVHRILGLFTGARIVVDTRCRGARRHRHRATVLERAGDLRMGRLRPR